MAYEMGYRYGNTIARKEKGLRAITCQDVIVLKLRGLLPRHYPEEL
jgi:hypothetical protein